ncbi:MAG: 3-phosphoserine/phosphohydroxythreonine transaminase [Gammaproteobacteria bacterium]|nr:3-phosphoserine/phosphohydroxythreonine transaminase [Gammaproteobacteria bacterium]MDE2344924.1 3-phosphoserine/phosphohydroxythreonine transaminase [Gammaproteobacteria bacterium]
MATAADVSRAARLRGRVLNFGAGPAMLPDSVLAEIQQELPDYQGTGMSMLEIQHRGPEFQKLIRQAEADLRGLMQIPDEYSVLFLHGGANLQFAMAPLNLAGRNACANYLNTGYWSARAIGEAQRICKVQVVADAEIYAYRNIPPVQQWQMDSNAAMLHYTVNETINGVEFHWLPDSGGLPLVADMTSMILSRPVEVSAHALIYAAAQKNLGIAGLTVVIVRGDALRDVPAGTPSMLDYREHIRAHSMLNTPPVFAWYVAAKMLAWIKQQGGVAAMASRNQRKAAVLYELVDASSLYQNAVEHSCRSWMNVPFQLADRTLEQAFLEAAASAGFVGLAGHRSAGGFRASLYNAMPESGVRALAEFMREFERARA